MADYAVSLAIGFRLALGVMVFALALTALLGRWITADESGMGFVLRAGVLIVLAVLAFHGFATTWYWLAVTLALVPLVDVWRGRSVTASWTSLGAQAQLARDLAAAAEQPANAVLRLNLGCSLLETGQIEAGLSALDEAAGLAPEDGVISHAAAAAEERWVKHCPNCGLPNFVEARVCRRCINVMDGGAALSALLGACRPFWLRLRRTS